MTHSRHPGWSRIIFIIHYSLFLILTPLQAHAQEESSGVYEGVAGLDWILVVLQNVLSIALQMIGVAVFGMLVVGSIKMLTSGGDPKAAASAKSTISMAIGGPVVAALAFFLFQIIAKITGVEGILTVSIPTLD